MSPMCRPRPRRMLVFVSGMQQTSVEDTLKDFWATRPRRPRRGRKLAGVAAGIGNRYGIDPIVVRVAFVVATFYGGAGILLYLLGWLLLPEQNEQTAPFESMVHHGRGGSTSTAFTVVLCLALIPAFWFFVDHEFTGIVGLVIVLGALFLLHRTRGHINRPTVAPMPPPDPTTRYEPPVTAPYATFPAGAYVPPAEPMPATPPAWDPLGAAPFAWDLPEPTPVTPESPPEPRRRRSKVGVLTVGAALVTAGTLALSAPYVGGWVNPNHSVGLVLAVIGLGLVGGSFVRGGRGLIGLAVPLSIAGLAMATISPDGFHGVGDINVRPTSVEQVQDEYRLSAGTIQVDLTGLVPTEEAPEDLPVVTMIRVDAGEAIVIVPENADVHVRCEVGVGDVNCLGRRDDVGSDMEFEDLGPDGEGGRRIELHVDVNAGDVEVRRG
jgi:phage shock protein PspC (stress-responsive transcriptional regulator)